MEKENSFNEINIYNVLITRFLELRTTWYSLVSEKTKEYLINRTYNFFDPGSDNAKKMIQLINSIDLEQSDNIKYFFHILVHSLKDFGYNNADFENAIIKDHIQRNMFPLNENISCSYSGNVIKLHILTKVYPNPMKIYNNILCAISELKKNPNYQSYKIIEVQSPLINEKRELFLSKLGFIADENTEFPNKKMFLKIKD